MDFNDFYKLSVIINGFAIFLIIVNSEEYIGPLSVLMFGLAILIGPITWAYVVVNLSIRYLIRYSEKQMEIGSKIEKGEKYE